MLRKLLDLSDLGPNQRRTVVIAAPTVNLPAILEKTAARFRLALPQEPELRRLVHEVVERAGGRHQVRVDLDDTEYRRLIDGLKGLTLVEAERPSPRPCSTTSRSTRATFTGCSGRSASCSPRRASSSTSRLGADEAELGGLGAFKAWLAKRKGAFTAGGAERSDCPRRRA